MEGNEAVYNFWRKSDDSSCVKQYQEEESGKGKEGRAFFDICGGSILLHHDTKRLVLNDKFPSIYKLNNWLIYYKICDFLSP